MDTTVAALGDIIVTALKDADYMQSTINQYRKSIKWLGVLAEEQDGQYTLALGQKFASMTVSPRTGKYSAQRHFGYGRLVCLLDSYVLTGAVDLSMRPRGLQKEFPNSPEFADLLDSWSQDMEQRGLARSTQTCFGGLACEYLRFLEAGRVSSWDAADGASVLGFLESLRDRWAASNMWSAVSSFRPFLKFTQRTDLLDALALARTKRHHDIIPMIDSGVERQTVDACQHRLVSARDAAITLLCLSTGLRACDVCSLQSVAFFGLMHSCGLRTCETRRLQPQDVDLTAGFINVLWSKGNRSRRLPLTDQIIEVLADCDKISRQQFGQHRSAFFVSSTAAPVALPTPGVMFNRIWNQAGLPLSLGGKQPHPYSFRHHFAYANIERWMAEGRDINAMMPYLSRYMGHATLDSTFYYIHTSPDFMDGYATLVKESQGMIPEVGFE